VTTGVFPPRQGRPAPDGPFEGVPAHQREPLRSWQVAIVQWARDGQIVRQ
jgi:hypothetical protein